MARWQSVGCEAAGQLHRQLIAGHHADGTVAAGRAGQLPSIDEVLATPDIERLVADAEELGDLGDFPSGTSRPPKAAGSSIVQQPDSIRTGAYHMKRRI